jgi:cytochrome c553
MQPCHTGSSAGATQRSVIAHLWLAFGTSWGRTASGGVDPGIRCRARAEGAGDPDCVVALCRLCHRAFEDGRLDLLPHLEPRHRPELAHGLSPLGVIELLERLTAERWAPERRRAA